MRFVSWNVNGFRAVVKKGFWDYFRRVDADVFSIQETKMQEDMLWPELGEEYAAYWNHAERKGYSGTAVFTRRKPLAVSFGEEVDLEREGRILTLEFERFFLVNVYTPNARRDLSRLPHRMEWEDRFREYLKGLDARKPVVACGDMNVAHREIDLKNPKANAGNHGFTPEEREKMTRLLEAGFVDTFRHLYPDRTDAYTWWSLMPGVRARNVGWRIDYFLISRRLCPALAAADIHSDVMGSDHCPVVLELDEAAFPDTGRPAENGGARE